MKVVTLGEVMLRLASQRYEKLMQSQILEASFGGGEANVAVSLAQFGVDVSFVSILPQNEIGQACLMELRKFGVDVSQIKFSKGRMGIYFLEGGANQKSSSVIYDRDGSALSIAEPDSFQWNDIFEHADWFHITGITPAISQNAADFSIQAVKTAKSKGLTISCDLNYRSRLWNYGKEAREIMGELVKYTDICIANEEDIQKALGIKGKDISVESGHIDKEKYFSLACELMDLYRNVRMIAITLRESISADHNKWSACLYNGKDFWHSTEYDICDIVDRVGGGDSFSAGLIYGLNTYDDPKMALEFAVAASCLKHSIKGDFNRVRIADVEAIVEGNVSGRIKR